MPRKLHWGAGGAVGTLMTERMVSYVLELQDSHDSEAAARALRVSREALVTCMRYIEKKIGRRLFHRAIGRGNCQWYPLDSAQDFFTWCGANLAGGADWPKLAKSS